MKHDHVTTTVTYVIYILDTMRMCVCARVCVRGQSRVGGLDLAEGRVGLWALWISGRNVTKNPC